MGATETQAAITEGPAGPAALVLVCEHASNLIPPAYAGLGLAPGGAESHAAWDPGALALTRALSARLGAPLVAGGVSRVVYDCNRPPEAASAIPERSEVWDIPGNRNLTPTHRAERVAAVYRPFTAAVEACLDRARPAALVTVHSFTPVWHGTRREVELGILHDADTRLADALLSRDWPGLVVRRNEPYGPADGVTHSLKLYGLSRGLPNAMIEVRNDLLADEVGIARIAGLLAPALTAALQAPALREAS